MKKNRNKQKNSLWKKTVDYTKRNYARAVFFIIGIIVTLLLTKACNIIIPDSPVVVEKNPDTINVVHVYEPLPDTTWTDNKNTENIAKTAIVNRSRNRTGKGVFDGKMVNKVMVSASFPNAKGYTIKSAAPYFSLEMMNQDQPFVDFVFHFFNEEIVSEIYCLSIKVFRNQGGENIYILDENYEKRRNENVIRLNNIFKSGSYQIEIGFFFTKDKDARYPEFYREIKYINNL